MEKNIIWSESAVDNLEDAYFYLLNKTKSIDIANHVVDTLTESVSILKTSAFIYEIDEMKKPIDENYRAFENSIIEFHIL